MTSKEIMSELERLGSPAIRKVLASHGAPKGILGVKIGDMKPIVKKVKMNHEVAMELYATGVSDAMYLAGLISDSKKMTKKELQQWADEATWMMISEYSVPWTTAESPFAIEMANKWIKSKEEKIAVSGWATYSSYISITPNDQIDLKEVSEYISLIEKNIHKAQNRVKYCMNGFLITAGGYIPELRDQAIKTAAKIGDVIVDMGDTSCKVPDVKSYIQKMVERGSDKKKRKTARC